MPCTRSLTCPSSKHSFSSSAPVSVRGMAAESSALRQGLPVLTLCLLQMLAVSPGHARGKEQTLAARGGQSVSRGKPLPEGLLQERLLTGSAVVSYRVPWGRARKGQGATNDPCSTRTCSGARARLKSAACCYGFFSAPAMCGCWFLSGGFSLNWALQAAMRHGAEAAWLSAAASTGVLPSYLCLLVSRR